MILYFTSNFVYFILLVILSYFILLVNSSYLYFISCYFTIGGGGGGGRVVFKEISAGEEHTRASVAGNPGGKCWTHNLKRVQY